MGKLRVAILADFREEKWPSMDLVAEMLATELQSRHGDSFEVDLRCAPFIRFNPLVGNGSATSARSASNVERALNRYLKYPLWLRGEREKFDLFHIIDHSYAHLANYLPSESTIVTCHDLEAFGSLLHGSSYQPRSFAYRTAARHVLNGLRRASIVSCVSHATRDAIVAEGLVKAEKTVAIPNGVDCSMSPKMNFEADQIAEKMLGARNPEVVEIVHVGSVEPRKRIDLLLQIFAGIRRGIPGVRLIRVGGGLTPANLKMAGALGIADRIATMPYLDRPVLAAIYRRASLLLLPSEAEGFGLPMLEAMACGCHVVASDLPVLGEVGGDAISYCKVGDIAEWVRTACALLKNNCGSGGQRENLIRRASLFSWKESASKTAQVYEDVALRKRYGAPEFQKRGNG